MPKGLISENEASLAAAKRVSRRRPGYSPGSEFLTLGEAKQPGGKIVQSWAVEDDWDVALLKSNTFEIEWPPKCGRTQSFPELDRAAWFDLTEWRAMISKGQMVFVDLAPSGTRKPVT